MSAGRQTELLGSAITGRGGAQINEAAVTRDYLARLSAAGVELRARAQSNAVQRAELLIPGIDDFLAEMAEAGMTLAVVSGASLPELQGDLGAIGLSSYFGERVLSPLDSGNSQGFTKEGAFRRLLADTGHRSMISFGDGVVETKAAVAIGAMAIGIAWSPKTKRFDEQTAARLRAAGASEVFADFRDRGIVDLVNQARLA